MKLPAYRRFLLILAAAPAIALTADEGQIPPPLACHKFTESVFFESARSGADRSLPTAVASESDLRMLGRNLELILQFQQHRFRVIGYTDDHECEGQECFALSRQRAESVHQWLVAHGAPEHLFIEVTGLGNSNPIDWNDTPEQRAHNRRVELVEEL